MEYNRTQLAENIGFTAVRDEKFNSSLLMIRFITEHSETSASANVLGISCLTATNSRYPTISALSSRLNELYGASLGSSAGKVGNVQILRLYSSWINNRYAYDGEDMQREMAELICGCLFSPNAQNGGFDEESFRILKNDLLDRIDGETNYKYGYAVSKALGIAFRGEPAAYPVIGKRRDAEAVTPQSALAAYHKLLETAQIEISFVSSEGHEVIVEILKKHFSGIKRNSRSYALRCKSPVKEQPETVFREMDVNQCNMIMVFKSDCDDYYALSMMNILFGDASFSKLFLNVREKLSLCYFCSSSLFFSKNAVLVGCGTDRDKVEQARDEILHQLDEMCRGNISDKEINDTFMSVSNTIRSAGDTLSSYSNWFFDRIFYDHPHDPAEYIEEFRKVTKERIVQAACSLKLDTFYCLAGKEEN